MSKYTYREHPSYETNIDLLRFYLSSYLGGDGYITKEHLHKHPREVQDKYDSRLERAYYLNYVYPVVRIHTQYVCGNVTRVATNEADQEEFEKKFYGNVTGDNLDLFSFMRDQSDLSSVFGYEGIIVDGTKAIKNRPKIATRVADETSQPVLRKVDATNIVDWSIDSRGLFNWVLIKSLVVTDANPMLDRKTVYGLELWTRNGVRYFRKDAKETANDWTGEYIEDVNAAVEYNYGGKVPFVMVRHTRTLLDGIPASMIKDIAHVNKSIFNYTSLRDSALYDQTFSIMTLPTEGEDGEEFERTVGENNFLTFSSFSNHAPGFITPPASVIESISGVIKGNIGEVFRLAILDKKSNDDGEQYATATGRMIDTQDTESALREKAELMELAEKEISLMYNLVRGKEGRYWEPTYPKSFDVRAFTQDVDDAIKEVSLGMGVEYEVKRKQGIAKKQFNHLETIELNKILVDIDIATRELAEEAKLIASPVDETGIDDINSNKEQ